MKCKGKMKTIKKYSTGISGLDTLFHGGIQLENFQNGGSSKDGNGLLIALKGAKGCNKTLLAMQLMQGLLNGLYDDFTNNVHAPVFISLNKSESDLSDMYYDVYISRLLNYLCITSVNDKATLTNKLMSAMFKNYPLKTGSKENNEGVSMIENIANRVFYYNTRTNGLHYRRVGNYPSERGYILGDYGDAEDNMLYQRLEKLNSAKISEILGKIVDQPIPPEIRRIYDIEYHYGEENESTNALSYIQKIIDKLYESTQNNNCFVIDGFSKLSTKELSELPYDELGKLLRKRNNVSILVFDERPEARIDADIVIDMRKTEATDEEYVYYELQISKSVFQTAALGWHQYKKRDTGIDVFPSIHMLLSKRNYLPYKLLTMHNHILQETYEEYLSYTDFCNRKETESSAKQDEISLYDEGKLRREYDILKSIVSRGHKNDSVDQLKDIIWGNIVGLDSNELPMHGWYDHFPSTAIIGNPNSYKRQFAIAGAFNAAKHNEHTIFVLFDKNEADMRRRMRCPSFMSCETGTSRWNCPTSNTNCTLCDEFTQNDCSIKECYKCYEYIHFFQVRMGCISAEEFFDALLKQIHRFADVKEKQPCHIVIDDLQKIDYSFPFLKKTPLFLSTLVTLCRQNYAELKIICDKRASLVGELCSLSDNVLCIYRDEADIDSLEVYMERNFGGIDSTGLAKYKISNTKGLFFCQNGKFAMNDKDIKMMPIGSMKEFWRKSYNITEKEHRIVYTKENKKE